MLCSCKAVGSGRIIVLRIIESMGAAEIWALRVSRAPARPRGCKAVQTMGAWEVAAWLLARISDGGGAARNGKGGYSERARRFAGAKIALKSAFFRFCGILSRAKCVCAIY